MASRKSAENRAWEAEMDAGTLAETQKILADKKRAAAARRAAQRKANEFARAAGGTTGKIVGRGIVRIE